MLSEQTGVSYPIVQPRKAKAEKHSKCLKSHNLHDINNHDIVVEVLRAKQGALDSLKDLGVKIKLDMKSVEHYELLEINRILMRYTYNDENDSTLMADTQEEIYNNNESTETLCVSEIDQLKDANVIEAQLHGKYIKALTFARKSETIPMYVCTS